MIEHASLPALRVNINGHYGTFYLNPKRDSHIGDGGAVSFPSFSRALVSFEVPGRFLETGDNAISFAAIPGGDGADVPDAGFNYDAIAMFEGPLPGSGANEISVQPTVFFKRQQGRLVEGVDVILRHGELPLRKATLTINGRAVMLESDGSQWGEQKERFYLPPFGPHTAVNINLDRGDKVDALHEIIEPQKQWTVTSCHAYIWILATPTIRRKWRRFKTR